MSMLVQQIVLSALDVSLREQQAAVLLETVRLGVEVIIDEIRPEYTFSRNHRRCTCSLLV